MMVLDKNNVIRESETERQRKEKKKKHKNIERGEKRKHLKERENRTNYMGKKREIKQCSSMLW